MPYVAFEHRGRHLLGHHQVGLKLLQDAEEHVVPACRAERFAVGRGPLVVLEHGLQVHLHPLVELGHREVVVELFT